MTLFIRRHTFPITQSKGRTFLDEVSAKLCQKIATFCIYAALNENNSLRLGPTPLFFGNCNFFQSRSHFWEKFSMHANWCWRSAECQNLTLNSPSRTREEKREYKEDNTLLLHYT